VTLNTQLNNLCWNCIVAVLKATYPILYEKIAA